jgi:subtilisin family serine protease
MRRRECKLLPHIKQPIYGLNSSSAQILPWTIKDFNVESVWSKSTGEDVIVAVIDTGCDITHDDIKNNIINGYNIVASSNLVYDGNGHGTHVAGTIAAINNNLGIVGVSPKTKIMPIKALADNGSGSNNDVASGIDYAVENGADIITMSLGSDFPSVRIEKSLIRAIEKRVAVFCAAGNSGIMREVNFPARYDQSICIGAINRGLDLCEFSCTGESLDFLAPGADIISCIPNNQYASMTGTSMATPFAVGCMSLFLSYARKISGDSKLRLTQEEIINHFKKYTRKLNNTEYSGVKRYEGYGIITPNV